MAEVVVVVLELGLMETVPSRIRELVPRLSRVGGMEGLQTHLLDPDQDKLPHYLPVEEVEGHVVPIPPPIPAVTEPLDRW
jgi:hypothetical protein